MSILIAESGSSKTDWRYIGVDGNISQMKTLGINTYFQDEESIYLEIISKIHPNIKPGDLKIFYYGTGVTNLEKADIIKNALFRVFPEAIIDVKDDMIAAARSLCINEPGIACILGTGANSSMYDGQSIIAQIPPLGFWLGDEGSGGYLGKQLITKYLRKELTLEIEEKFIKRFGKLERTEILEKAYKQPFPNRYFASFSKFLFDNRAIPEIYLLIYESFTLFFEKSVIKYSNFQNYKVHFTGSVAFYYSDILRKAAVNCGVTVGVILESPIAGLVLYHKNDLNI